MGSHNENEHIQKEANNLGLTIFSSCTYCTPNIYNFKSHNAWKKIYVSSVTTF